MMPGQFSLAQNMGEADWKKFEAVAADLLREKLGRCPVQFEFAQSVLDGNFPGHHMTEQKLMAGLFQKIKPPGWQFGIILHKPKKDVGIEQDFHM